MFSDTLWLLLPPHSPRSFSPPGRWEAPGRGCVPRTVCSAQIRPLQQEPRALSCSALLWRGGGAARQRGWTWKGASGHSKGRDEETEEQDIAADANTLQQTVQSSQGWWRKKKRKSCRNASECVSQTKKNQIVTTLLNLLLKTATNLSHSVLCQRVPNL